MSLLDRSIGVCFIPLILILAFDQTFHVSEIFVLACRYIASVGTVRSSLSTCFDYLRASQESDMPGSYPGSPLVLSTLFDTHLPSEANALDNIRQELKSRFYEAQYDAGRISFAQKLTFLNDPSATREHEKEDSKHAQQYQATMAKYQAAPRIETTREWVRRMREEREAAEFYIEDLQSTEGAPCSSHPRPERSLEPYRGSAHALAQALISDMPPHQLPKPKALRGLLPRDSKGNIVFGTDRVYEAYLMQEARAKQPPPGIEYRRWDSFTLTVNEKIRFKSLKVSDRLNLWSYSVRHWKEDVFQIHPPDNRSMFIDLRDGSYHEMWEWDYVNNVALWRIMVTDVPWNKPNDGVGGLFGSNNNRWGTGGFGTSDNTTAKPLFGTTNQTSGPWAETPNNGPGWGAGTQPLGPMNTGDTTNTGGIGGEAPKPGDSGSLFGRQGATNAGNTGNTGSSGVPLFPDEYNQPKNNPAGPSPDPQAGGSNEAPPTKLSADNPLSKSWMPEAQHQQIADWIDRIKDTMGEFTYDQVKRDTNNPGETWSDISESAARYLRFIEEFVSDGKGNWDKSCNLSVSKAQKMGIKSQWWKALGTELKKVSNRPQTTEDSPLKKLFVQFWRVHKLCRVEFP